MAEHTDLLNALYAVVPDDKREPVVDIAFALANNVMDKLATIADSLAAIAENTHPNAQALQANRDYIGHPANR